MVCLDLKLFDGDFLRIHVDNTGQISVSVLFDHDHEPYVCPIKYVVCGKNGSDRYWISTVRKGVAFYFCWC